MTPAPVPPRTLADARALVGLTVRQLAAQAGVSASTIVAYERGRGSRPWPETIRKLAEPLRIERGTDPRIEVWYVSLRHTTGFPMWSRRLA